MKKILALLVALLMVCLTGCGSKPAAQTQEVEGETQTWGNLSVFVPKGMKIVGGDLFDSSNPDALTVELEEDSLSYAIIAIHEEASIDEGQAFTREVNDDCTFTDLSYPLGNGIFQGFTYESYGITCVDLKGNLGNGFVQITAAQLPKKEAEFMAIIKSIKILSVGSPTGGTEEVQEEETTTTAAVEETAIQKAWNGWWYGVIDMNGCTNKWEYLNGYDFDIVMKVELEGDNKGSLKIYEPYGMITAGIEDGLFAEVNCYGDESFLYGDAGTSFGAEIVPSDWMFVHFIGDEEKIGISSSYTDDENNKLGYDLYLRPWGSDWEGDSFAQFIPNYDAYWEAVNSGITAGQLYFGEEEGSQAASANTASAQTGDLSALGANPATLDIDGYGVATVLYPADKFEYDKDYGKLREKNDGSVGIMISFELSEDVFEYNKKVYSGDSYTSQEDYSLTETTVCGYKALVVTYTDWLNSSMYVILDFGGRHGDCYGIDFMVSADTLEQCQTDLVWAIINSIKLLK